MDFIECQIYLANFALAPQCPMPNALLPFRFPVGGMTFLTTISQMTFIV
jgi:hypothetical protein